ncbi:hypothetical protein [Microbacterium yannicii]|nr:hypothetical protein [Microbacterium yannicii]MCO5951895.1 hypothetical protein [Microbacterium yannicii]
MRAAIDGLLLAVADDDAVNVSTPALRVLRAVLERIGPGGYCWADAFGLADAARLRVAKGARRGAPATDTAERALRAWAALGVLERLEARSQGGAVRHVLYYCPRLTGIPAPLLSRGLRYAVLTPCETPECEPEVTVPEAFALGGAHSAAPVHDWEREARR